MAEPTVSMKYVFNAYTSGLFGGTNEITQNNYTSYIDTSTGQGNARERDDAQVIITITYTFGDFTHTVTETTTRKWDTV